MLNSSVSLRQYSRHWLKTPWHEMPSHHPWAPLTSLSLLHAGKNLLYQFAAISHQENWESPSKCLPPSIPSPALNVNTVHGQSLLSAAVSTGLFISLDILLQKQNRFPAPCSSSCAYGYWLESSVHEFSVAETSECSQPCPARAAPRFFRPRVTTHHLQIVNRGIWRGLCMEGRLTWNRAVWLENMGGLTVVFTATNSPDQTGQSLSFFPPSTWKAQQICYMHLLQI